MGINLKHLLSQKFICLFQNAHYLIKFILHYFKEKIIYLIEVSHKDREISLHFIIVFTIFFCLSSHLYFKVILNTCVNIIIYKLYISNYKSFKNQT